VTRTLLHSFDPPAESPVAGPTVGLEVSEIEDAGIREVLQTPGTAYGAWSILDALLTPTGTGTPFIFKEPLGQAREVKVALSGLFGRFVARAYLERYFKLSIFAHLGSRPGSPQKDQGQAPFPRRPTRLDRLRLRPVLPHSRRGERLS
jgi:hypothetical protein